MTAEHHTVAAVDRWQCTITAEGGVTVSPIDLLWNFFILSGLQPQPQQRLLAYQRAQALRAFEKRDHSRAITLIHRVAAVQRRATGYAAGRVARFLPRRPIDAPVSTPELGVVRST